MECPAEDLRQPRLLSEIDRELEISEQERQKIELLNTENCKLLTTVLFLDNVYVHILVLQLNISEKLSLSALYYKAVRMLSKHVI